VGLHRLLLRLAATAAGLLLQSVVRAGVVPSSAVGFRWGELVAVLLQMAGPVLAVGWAVRAVLIRRWELAVGWAVGWARGWSFRRRRLSFRLRRPSAPGR